MRQSSIVENDRPCNRKFLSRGELRLWATAIVAIAFWANIIRGAAPADGMTLASMINSIFDDGAFDVFAWAMVLARVFRQPSGPPAGSRQVVAAVALGVVVLVPARLASGLALLALGLFFYTDARLPREIRQLRLVLCALAFETLWMSPLMAWLHVLVGSLDAGAAAWLLRAFGQAAASHGNVVENASSGFSIAVWPYCASTFPLADISLAFLVTVLYRERTLRWTQLPWLGMSFVASVIMTEFRLAMLAIDADSYQWWHYGTGVTVYALAALAVAVACPVLATWRPDASERGPIAGTVA